MGKQVCSAAPQPLRICAAAHKQAGMIGLRAYGGPRGRSVYPQRNGSSNIHRAQLGGTRKERTGRLLQQQLLRACSNMLHEEKQKASNSGGRCC